MLQLVIKGPAVWFVPGPWRVSPLLVVIINFAYDVYCIFRDLGPARFQWVKNDLHGLSRSSTMSPLDIRRMTLIVPFLSGIVSKLLRDIYRRLQISRTPRVFIDVPPILTQCWRLGFSRFDTVPKFGWQSMSDRLQAILHYAYALHMRCAVKMEYSLPTKQKSSILIIIFKLLCKKYYTVVEFC